VTITPLSLDSTAYGEMATLPELLELSGPAGDADVDTSSHRP
jgi:hypothetical protein